MNSKLLLILAGILTIVCAWLPWASIMGITVTGFQGSMKGNPGLLPIILGALMAVMGLVGKKWSYIVAIVFGLCTIGLGIKHYMDVTSVGADAGYGLYVMMAGGLLGIAGGAMGMRGSKSTAA